MCNGFVVVFELHLQLLYPCSTCLLQVMQVLYFILGRKNKVSELVDVLLRLPDCIFFQLFVKGNHFIVTYLYLCLQCIYGFILSSDLLPQFFKIFCPPYFLSFKKSNTSSFERIFSLHVFAGLFQYDGTIAVMHRFFIFCNKDIAQQVGCELAVTTVYFYNIKRWYRSIGLVVRFRFPKFIQQEKVRLTFFIVI